jgi:hypothetical protein
MVDELDEARQRAKAAWSLIQADVVRLKEAVRTEVDQVRQLGPASIWNSYPLPILGGIAGVGLLFGVRGGRRKAAYRAIVKAGTEVVSQATQTIAQQPRAPKPEKSLKRKLIETLVLAIASKGAQTLAEVAQSRVQSQLVGGQGQAPSQPVIQPGEPERVRSQPHLVIPHGNL